MIAFRGGPTITEGHLDILRNSALKNMYVEDNNSTQWE